MKEILKSRPVVALVIPVIVGILHFAGIVKIEIVTKDNTAVAVETKTDTQAVVTVNGESQVVTVNTTDTK